MAAAAVGAMAVALYLQEVLGQHPCPLCISQRACMISIALLAFVAAMLNPKRTGQRLWGCLLLLAAGSGGLLAGRQVWLQHLPADQVPACGPGLAYLFQNFPLQQAIKVLFMGDGNCAEVSWSFLGISIAGLSLIAFIGFALIATVQIMRKS